MGWGGIRFTLQSVEPTVWTSVVLGRITVLKPLHGGKREDMWLPSLDRPPRMLRLFSHCDSLTWIQQGS